MSIQYRPEIDGLRAISVFAVMIYHAGFVISDSSVLPGGFIGVDVFFVISGYLITSILIKDLAEGVFSFGRFYLRRARRILPILALVVACTTLLAFFVIRLEGLREYYLTAIGALWFSSNIILWRQGGYYAEPSALKPLLHTWSLGVEEQFYLGFPILLFLAYKYARRYVVPLLALVAMLSLVLAVYGSAYHPTATFYLLPTRAWELLAGALLATAGSPKANGRDSKAAWLSMTGLALIVVSLFVFNYQTRHPSLFTLLPVIGAMLVIRFSGQHEKCLVTRVLGSKGLVYIGLISYGLYLWHFPLFAFYRYALGEPVFAMKVGLLLLSVLLAALSFHLLERPIRLSRVPNPLPFVRGMTFAILVLTGLSAVGFGSVERQASSVVVFDRTFDLNIEMEKRFARYSEDCVALGWVACSQVQRGTINVLIVGDSVVDDTYNMLDRNYPDYHLIRSTLGGCPPHPDMRSVLDFELPGLQKCLALNRERFGAQALAGVDGVVIHIDYSWFTPEDLRPYLDFLRASGVDNVMLFGTYITLTQHMSESFAIFTTDDTYRDLTASTIVVKPVQLRRGACGAGC